MSNFLQYPQRSSFLWFLQIKFPSVLTEIKFFLVSCRGQISSVSYRDQFLSFLTERSHFLRFLNSFLTKIIFPLVLTEIEFPSFLTEIKFSLFLKETKFPSVLTEIKFPSSLTVMNYSLLDIFPLFYSGTLLYFVFHLSI